MPRTGITSVTEADRFLGTTEAVNVGPTIVVIEVVLEMDAEDVEFGLISQEGIKQYPCGI